MKYLSYTFNGEPEVGSYDAEKESITPLALEAGEAADGLLSLVRRQARGQTVAPVLDLHRALSEVVLRAPFPRPRRNIFCIGKNYHEHALEFSASGFDSGAGAGSLPAAPIVFSKVPETVVAHGEPIPVQPGVSTAVDYEAELAVVIGKGGKAIPKAGAMDHVWGYTLVNDVTARDLQVSHGQWLIGKSQDGFCPMGPVAVTADEVDLQRSAIRLWVNDELRQDARIAQMIFDIPTLIESLSRGITLYPGDLIATGTPAGVGVGFEPPRYLRHGDRVRIEFDGIGVLENPVVFQD